jgi:glycosyltransferase involved in cell wall biosynthesis
MRIGIDAQPLQGNALHAGIGVSLRGLVDALAASGAPHDFALVLADGARRADPPGLGRASDWPRLRVPRGDVRARWGARAERRRQARWMRDARLDLLHAQSLAELEVVVPRPTRRCRVVVTVHDLIPWLFREDHDAYWPRGLGRYDFARRLGDAGRADAWIVPSAQTRRDCVRHLGWPAERIFVVPQAAGLRFAPVRVAERLARLRRTHGLPDAYLLYVGGYYSPRKRVDRLLAAYRRYLEKGDREVGLVLTGARDVGPRHPLRPLLDDPALAGRLHPTGFVDEADLPALYSGATALVHPSTYEGFGLPPLEAMACGTPVVTSPCASLPEVVGDAALLADPLDADALAAAMRRVVEDGELRAELSRRGLARSRAFSWERTARETLGVYDAVLGGRRSER